MNEAVGPSDEQCGGEILEQSSSASEMMLEPEEAGEELFRESGNESDSPPQQKRARTYTPRSCSDLLFLKRPVCQWAHRRLMGIGDSVACRVRQGERVYSNAQRSKLPKHPATGHALRHQAKDKWQRVLCFLWLVYHSQAEVLPTKFVMPNGYVQEGLVPDEEEDFQIRFVHTFIQGLADYHRMPNLSALGPGSFEGPRRYLQHRKVTDLYNEYIAHETSCNEKPCSLQTFIRCFKPIKKTHLTFRDRAEHAECNVCSSLKRRTREAKNESERQRVYRAYSAHVLAQWVDRQVYWHQRSLAQSWFRALLDL